MEFALRLRNENADYFFKAAKVDWWGHTKWFKKKAEDQTFEFFIIKQGYVNVGTLAVEHRPTCEFLQNLCIDTSYRGKGIAKQAIKLLMVPRRFIIAQVKSDNKKVIKMYEKLGFWQVKR